MAKKKRTLSPDILDPRNALQFYSRAAVKNADFWTDKLVRSEYSRLRSIAQKRLKNLEKYEPESYAYTHNRGQYPTMRGMSAAEIREKLPELARFIAAKTGTVTGIRAQRNKAAQTMQERGYNIAPEDMKAFGQFMDEWRTQKLNRAYGSQEVVDLFTFIEEHETVPGVITENFREWLADRKKLKELAQWGEEYGLDIKTIAEDPKHWAMHSKQLMATAAKRIKNGQNVDSDTIIEQYEKMERQRVQRNKKRRK